MADSKPLFWPVDKNMLLGPKSNVTNLSCMVNEMILLRRPSYKGIKFSSTLDPKYYRYGFRILFPEIGKFIDDSGDVNSYDESLNLKSYVVYLHEKSGEQIIEFISDELGSFKFYAVIQGITIHDHASIAMGGPAYATYFTEPAQEPEE